MSEYVHLWIENVLDSSTNTPSNQLQGEYIGNMVNDFKDISSSSSSFSNTDNEPENIITTFHKNFGNDNDSYTNFKNNFINYIVFDVLVELDIDLKVKRAINYIKQNTLDKDIDDGYNIWFYGSEMYLPYIYYENEYYRQFIIIERQIFADQYFLTTEPITSSYNDNILTITLIINTGHGVQNTTNSLNNPTITIITITLSSNSPLKASFNVTHNIYIPKILYNNLTGCRYIKNCKKSITVL